MKQFFIAISLFFGCSFLLASSTTGQSDTATQMMLLNDKIDKAFSRTTGQAYQPLNDGSQHWISDFFDFFKYQQAQQQQVDAYLYFMRPPSLPEFLLRYAIAKENNMFAPPFTSYDDVTQSLESNYIYNTNSGTYQQFIIRQFIDYPNVDNTYDPSDNTHLPRGKMYSGSTKVNNLKSVSTIQDMVFKHYHQYCHQGGETTTGGSSDSEQNYLEVCQAVLEYLQDKTGGAFSTDGVSTLNGNADINAQSLLGLAGYTSGSSSDSNARNFIQNIVDAYPKAIIPFQPTDDGSYKPDPSDIEGIAERLVNQAYRSISFNVLNDLKTRRLRSIPPPSAAGQSSSGTLSTFEFLHQSGTSRMLDTNRWIVELSSLSTEGLLREIALMQATALLFQYQHYRQLENIEALEAALLTSMLRILELKDMVPSQQDVNQTLNAIQG
jgi:hypothetical protein